MSGGIRTAGASPRQSTPDLPLVSIITVCMNGAAHIEQAIVSVLDQGYCNVEYLVIDGGSTDGTLDIIRKYQERIDYWASEPDNGIYEAMNKGLQLAQGELIGLLNADDFYETDALEKVVECYLDAERPAIYYGDNLVLQEDLQLKYRHCADLRYWRGMSICHQAMFVHRNIYAQLGVYCPEYRFAADYDFLLRALTAQVPLIYVPACVVNYRNTGLTSRHYVTSMDEARRINQSFFGGFSRYHGVFLAGYCKTLLLHGAEQVLLRLLGRRTLDRLRRFYLRKVLLRAADFCD